MKKVRICLALVSSAVLAISVSQGLYAQIISPPKGPKVIYHIDYGHGDAPASQEHRRCSGPGGICDIIPVLDPSWGWNMFASVRSGYLDVTFTQPVPESELTIYGNERYLVAYTDIIVPLDVKTATAVGVTSFTIAQGEYHVDFGSSPFGTVQLKLKSTPPNASGSMQVR